MTLRQHADPFFGHDPWLGPRPASTVEADTLAATGTFMGADTLAGSINSLPNGLDMYASYVDNYGGWGELVSRFAHSPAFLLSITIFGNAAHCADVEPGAMHPTDLPHWLDHVALITTGLTPSIPWVYTSASQMAAANQYIGSRKVIRWSAHYGHGFHVCAPHTCGYPQADWTQCYDKGANGENIDRSIGRVLPTPVIAPNKRATGAAHFTGAVNFDSHHWTIQGAPGNVNWGSDNVTWLAEIQVNGSNGSWQIQSLPFGTKPATKPGKALGAPAVGTANFHGHVNLDTGQWAIAGTPGTVKWGAADHWSAHVTVTNRDGQWTVQSLPFTSRPLG